MIFATNFALLNLSSHPHHSPFAYISIVLFGGLLRDSALSDLPEFMVTSPTSHTSHRARDTLRADVNGEAYIGRAV